mgnify:CR=1 FL=1
MILKIQNWNKSKGFGICKVSNKKAISARQLDNCPNEKSLGKYSFNFATEINHMISVGINLNSKGIKATALTSGSSQDDLIFLDRK